MDTEKKILLGIVLGTVAIVFGAVFFIGQGSSDVATKIKGKNCALVSKDEIAKTDDLFVGSDSAKVVVEEYSDFECPACKAAGSLVRTIETKYQGKIKLVYRFFPLPSHEFGMDSAVAAEAAAVQGKFWEFHDKLFDQQPYFSRDKLVVYAKDLGLDTNKFLCDLDSDVIKSRVESDQKKGLDLKVNATPTFFVNGQKIVDYTKLDEEISSRLK